MSQENAEWLNTMTLIGFTEKRDNAWHYQEALQGDEPNHYVGPVPVEDVRRRLFDWKAESEPVFVLRDGVYVPIPERQAISASDTGDVLGIFKDGYQPHQYDQWLVETIETILDDDLAIGSAGLLRNKAQAWVQVEVPENVTTPEGVVFRPHLTGATSFDGSLATTFKRMVTEIVCDNTMATGLSEKGQTYRLKHTRYSNLKIADAREALAIVYTIADDFAAEVARLSQWEVTPKQFSSHLDLMIPITDKDGQPIKGRGLTIAEKKRDVINTLYRHDERAAPWAGTAFGVLQAYNTFLHHYATIKGVSRVQRNRDLAISGRLAAHDLGVLENLALVTTAAA